MTLVSTTTSVYAATFQRKHGGKQLPCCMNFFKRLVTPVMSIWFLFHVSLQVAQLVARMADHRPLRAFRRCLTTNHFGSFPALFHGFDLNRVSEPNRVLANLNIVRHVCELYLCS